MFRKLIIYLLAFNIAFIPIQRANAVVPVVAGAIWAVEIAAPHAIRYLATEIAISSVVKAVQVSNAYYSATSTLANAKFLSHFKSKASIGIAAFTGVLAALGYSLTNDGTLVSDSIVESDAQEVQGFYWVCGSNIHYSSARAACEATSSFPLRVEEIDDNYVTYCRIYDTETGACYPMGNPKAWRYDCSSSPSSSASTCSPDFESSPGEPVTDEQATTNIIDHLKSLPDSEQLKFFGDSDGVIDTSLVSDIDSENAPLMPDGQSPIPDIGDPSWNNAHLITTGVAQSSDSSSPNYVSTEDWGEADYLANTVANGNDYITGINSGTIALPNTDTGSNSGSGTNVNVTVDVSGVESRIDITNSLSESILEQVTKANVTSIPINITPDKNQASSFWEPRYPDGFAGVWNNYNNNLQNTALLGWIDSFKLTYVSDGIPSWSMCFDLGFVDFGCHVIDIDGRVWLAIRAFILFTAAMLARRLVFGG